MLQITLRRCGNCSLPLDIDEARAKIGSEPAQTIGPTGKTTEKIARDFGAQSNRRLHVWMMVLLIILLGLAITLKSPLLQSSNPFMVIAGVLGLLMTIVLVMHMALKKHLHTFSCPDCGTPIADFIETGNYGDIKYYCNKCDIVWNTRMHRPPDL